MKNEREAMIAELEKVIDKKVGTYKNPDGTYEITGRKLAELIFEVIKVVAEEMEPGTTA